MYSNAEDDIAISVRPSVCPSCCDIISKRMHI